jgi:transposase
MEDLLSLYALPYNPLRPVVCFDERPCQLLDSFVSPIPMKPGKGGERKVDSHYQRNGVCSILLATEPRVGVRVQKTEYRRTKKEFAEFLSVLDTHYPGAEKIVLVLDNLSTHTYGSLYETFFPQEARRLAARFEFHYTPKKGSWLNMAELEFSVLARQCLGERIASLEEMRRKVDAWIEERNRKQVKISWQFTTLDAREKFDRQYKAVRNQLV